ncbi:unnamed protein product [Dovyalis caffra]|uniref:Uncharacterized protein n=1 Tax=Dovyalis caffra TaxID=77055 RepID=A0AAV1R0D3_9ROSI|nr:unnamed protein product [Dovyalis caffra]
MELANQSGPDWGQWPKIAGYYRHLEPYTGHRNSRPLTSLAVTMSPISRNDSSQARQIHTDAPAIAAMVEWNLSVSHKVQREKKLDVYVRECRNPPTTYPKPPRQHGVYSDVPISLSRIEVARVSLNTCRPAPRKLCVSVAETKRSYWLFLSGQTSTSIHERYGEGIWRGPSREHQTSLPMSLFGGSAFIIFPAGVCVA